MPYLNYPWQYGGMAKKAISDRGPRNAKLTVLVPAAVLEDLRVLRELTSQSTGDLVNRLIEAELERQADLLEAGRELLKARDELLERARAKDAKGSVAKGPDASQGPGGRRPQGTGEAEGGKLRRGVDVLRPGESVPLPTPEELREYAGEAADPDEVRRRIKHGGAFLEHMGAKGSDHVVRDDLVEFLELMKGEYPRGKTAVCYFGKVSGLVLWKMGRS